MRLNHRLAIVLAAAAVFVSVSAAAQTPAAAPAAAPAAVLEAPQFDPLLVLDDGRAPWAPPDPGMMRAQIHGEYQLRYQRQSDTPLTAPGNDLGAGSLGQSDVLSHWLRITPRFDFRDKLSLIGQIDLPYGFILGQTTRLVGAAREPLDERNPLRMAPRWLYLESKTPYGTWRIGQQGSHWGMGLLANDGNHPSLFGDYRNGSIVERLLFATRPAGKNSPLTIALAGDLVFRDRQADLGDGDRAFQGVLAATLGSGNNQIGLYGVIRHQYRNKETFDVFTPYTETLDARIGDVHGRFAAPVPGMSGYVFGEVEAAAVFGSTNYVRTPELGARNEDEKVRSYGGAARLGAVHVANRGQARWGDWVVAVEYGYASGDANPADGTQRRFSFEPNHKVGLVLFDQVLAWTTARSAVLAADPSLVNRASPGLQYYPSDGGIFGATYLYPTVVVRPEPWLDIKGALLIAQATSDVVDPYRFGVLGSVEGWRGGDSRRHDLGVEGDLGVEARVDLNYDMTLQLGAQAGVLFPGHALDDDAGNGMPTQGVAVGRLGLQY